MIADEISGMLLAVGYANEINWKRKGALAIVANARPSLISQGYIKWRPPAFLGIHLVHTMDQTKSVTRIESTSGWDEWRESLSRYCGLRCSADTVNVLPSRTKRWAAGDVTILDLDITGQHWSSIKEADQRWVEETLVLKVVTNGSLIIEQDGIDRRFGPGSLVLIDPARQLTEHFLKRVQIAVVLMPKKTLRSRGLLDKLPGLMVPDIATADVAAVRDFALCVARQAGATSSETGQRSGEHLLSLMEILLSAPENYNRSRSNSAILTRAKQIIAGRFAEMGLNPVDIASELHISVGHLNRVFKNDGSSVMRHVWTLRVEHAARLLSRASNRRIQIQEVAYQSGFSSAAHFSRMFKDRFGTSPREMSARGSGDC